MKFITTIKTFAAALVLAASGTSAIAALVPATVIGSSFSEVSLGSFDVLSTSNVVGSLGFAPLFDFGSFILNLQSVTFSGGSVGSQTFTGSSFSLSNVAAGTYLLSASGTLSGSGPFALIAADVAITPVPEPESYAMLLAGLGLMGAIARRRLNKSEA